MKDKKDGKVDVSYEFDPPVHAQSPDTPALRLGKKVIRTIQDAKENGW